MGDKALRRSTRIPTPTTTPRPLTPTPSTTGQSAGLTASRSRSVEKTVDLVLGFLDESGISFSRFLEAAFSVGDADQKKSVNVVFSEKCDSNGLTWLDRVWSVWSTGDNSSRKNFLQTFIGNRAVEIVNGERVAGHRMSELKLNMHNLTAEAIKSAATMSDSFKRFKHTLPFTVRVLDCLAAGENPSSSYHRMTKLQSNISPSQSRPASPFVPGIRGGRGGAQGRKRVSGKFQSALGLESEMMDLVDNPSLVDLSHIAEPDTWSDARESQISSNSLLSEQDLGPGHRDAQRAIVNSVSSLLFCSQRSSNALAAAVGITVLTGGVSRALGLLSGLSLSISDDSCNAGLKSLSEDCVQKATEVAWDPSRCCMYLTDNFDWYFRKANQRLNNRATQLSAATVMVFPLPPTIPPTALDNRPSRKHTHSRRETFSLATHVFQEDSPDLESGLHDEALFSAASILLDHLPGLQKRQDFPKWKAKLSLRRPHIRPLWTSTNQNPPSKLHPVRKVGQNIGTTAGIGKMIEDFHTQIRMNPNASDLSPAERARILDRLEWRSEIWGADLGGIINGRANGRHAADEPDIMSNQSMVEWETMPWHEDANFDFALLKVHWGNPTQDPTSLAHYISLLKRRRITTSKMEYHETRSLFEHVLAALLMQGLGQIVFGENSSYERIASWEGTTFEAFIDAVQTVIDRYASTAAGRRAQQGGDDVKAHAIWMARDMLVSRVYKDAIKWADAGRCLRIERVMLMIFWCAGSYKYAREILHRISRLEHELAGPEHDNYRAAKEAACFFNGSGVPGKAHGLDLELESSHGFEKRWGMAQGAGASFESIRDKTSAPVFVIRDISTHVAVQAGAPEIKRTNYNMDASLDICALVLDMSNHKIHKQHTDRRLFALKKSSATNPKPDILDACSEGTQRLRDGGFETWRQDTLKGPGFGYGTETAGELIEHIGGGEFHGVDVDGVSFD